MQVELPDKPLAISSIIRGRFSTYRISLPVRNSDFLYSHFKHVSGVPRGKSGYPLNKLRMLDTLIDRLKAIKGERAYVHDTTGLSEEALDAIIGKYSKDLHNAVHVDFSLGESVITANLVNVLG